MSKRKIWCIKLVKPDYTADKAIVVYQGLRKHELGEMQKGAVKSKRDKNTYLATTDIQGWDFNK